MPSMDSAGHNPIGIFDSGVGGLAIYRAIRELLPAEDLIYVADTGYGPYGGREPEYIRSRSVEMATTLAEQGVKAVVVACNTATVFAIDILRAQCSLPVVGVEPGIKPAVAVSKSKKIVLLATLRAIESESVKRLCRHYASEVEISLVPCTGLVEQVEAGDLRGARTLDLLRHYLYPTLEDGADTIVLGCTHFIFLAEQIHQIAPRDITVVEPSRAVALQLARRIDDECSPAQGAHTGTDRFFTTATSPEVVGAVASMLLGRTIEMHSARDLAASSAA